MNLQEMVQARPSGKRCILLKKTSTCKDTSRLSKYIESYLDETHKGPELSSQPAQPARRASFQGLMTRTKAHLKQGIGYLTKEEKGDIHVYGFMRGAIEGIAGKPIRELTNLEIAKTSEAVWKEKIKAKKLTKVAHKLVFSFDPELTQMMTLAKIGADEELLHIVKTTMDTYAKRFYPGEELGYLVGIHHDRKHIHAHVLLYPQTDKGTGVNVSHQSKVKLEDGSYVRVDYQGFLKATMEKLGKDVYQNKIRKPTTAMELPVEYRSQGRLLALAALDQCEADIQESRTRGAQISPGELWSRTRIVKKKYETLAPEPMRLVLEAAYEKRLKMALQVSQEEAEKKLIEAEEVQAKLKAKMAEQRKNRKPWSPNNPMALGSASRKYLKQDIYKVKKLLYGAYKLEWNLPAFLGHKEGKWFVNRMKQQDELGFLLKKMFSDISESFQHKDVTNELYRIPKKSPDTFRFKKQIIDRNLCQLKFFERGRLQAIGSDINDLKQTKIRELQTQEEMRLRLQAVALDVTDYRAIAKGRLPIYLQQYQGWKVNNQQIRIALTGDASLNTKQIENNNPDFFAPISKEELQSYVTEEHSRKIVSAEVAERTHRTLAASRPIEKPKSFVVASKATHPELSRPLSEWDTIRVKQILSSRLKDIQKMNGKMATKSIKDLFAIAVDTEADLEGIDI